MGQPAFRDYAFEVKSALLDPVHVCEVVGAFDKTDRKSFKRQSRGITVRCPWHNDSNPSCSCTIGDGGTFRAKCQSCGVSADVLGFIAAVKGMDIDNDFPGVLRASCDIAGIQMEPGAADGARRGLRPGPRVVRPKTPTIDNEELHAIAKDGVNQTDTGNAERFRKDYKARVRHCHAYRKWFIWDGRQWPEDATGQVWQLAKATVRGIYGEAEVIVDDKDRAACVKWGLKSEAQARIDAMLKLSKSELPVTPEQFDADPWVMNCENGIIALKTGEPRDHDPLKLCTKLAPVLFNPDATCPTFERFLSEVLPDVTVRDFLRRFFGSALTGVVHDNVLVICVGTGANGKTTLLEAIRHACGDYAAQVPTELLMEDGNEHPTKKTTLKGLRLAIAAETQMGRALDEATIKTLTGGEPIVARYMRGDFFSFEPTHKLILCTNHRPIIKGTDEGIWRRVKLVPFNVVVPEANRDPLLLDKLKAEAPGILAWLVRGCLEWQRDGLAPPDAVKVATKEYRDDSDTVGAFVTERCTVHPSLRVGATELFEAYKRRCADEGDEPASQKTFGAAILARGFDRKLSRGRKQYVGLGVKAESQSGDHGDHGDHDPVNAHEQGTRYGEPETRSPPSPPSPPTTHNVPGRNYSRAPWDPKPVVES